jgi:hypothetical protein
MPNDRPAVADTSNYKAFFRDQETKVGALDQRRLSVAAVVAVALTGLLIFLQSPWLVWLWVTVLYGVTFYGFGRLHMALEVTKSALRDLRDLAEFLQNPRTRAEVESYVGSKISPDDSNVPEALAALLSGQVGGERVRAAANSAFSQPASELSVAQFLRTSLVLGGLFGTVLFFAVELGRPELLSGDLSTLLPGLRGALASTLTGILGSVTLGYVGSKIDQIVERSVWETESLIGGPFARSLAMVPEATDLESEVQLWHSLLSEVAQLRRETQESYAKLGNDVTAHVVALQALSKQLQEIPPLQVPPQLASLGDSVAVFKAGTEQLQATVGSLVNAVATVGLSVPTQTLETLRVIRDEAAGDRARVHQSFSIVEQRIASNESAISSVARTVVERAGQTDAALSVMRSLQEQQLSKIDQSLQVAEGTREVADSGLRQVAQVVNPLPDAVSRIADVTSRTADRAAGIARLLEEGLTPNGGPPVISIPKIDGATGSDGGSATLEELCSRIERVPGQLGQTTEQLAMQVEAIRQAGVTLQDRSDQLVDSLDQVAASQKAIVGLAPKLEAMQRWQERVVRAPLMRVLLLSFRRGGSEQPSHGA